MDELLKAPSKFGAIPMDVPDSPIYDSAGTAALKEARVVEAKVAQEKNDAEAEKAWRALAPKPLNYSYKSAYSDGIDLSGKAPLPNKYILPMTMNLGGFDLATGKHYYGAQDPEGLHSRAMLELRASSLINGQRPAEDVASLGKMAAVAAKQRKTYEDFAKEVPNDWSEEHKRMAWAAGKRQRNFEQLYLDSQIFDTKYELSQASVPYEATLASKEFSDIGRKTYKAYTGEEFGGGDIDAAKWLASHYRAIDWNTGAMALVVTRLTSAGKDTTELYRKGYELWGNTEMEKSVTAQLGNLGRAILDPANAMGGVVGKYVIRSGAHSAFKKLITRMAVPAGAGSSGAVMGGVQATGLPTLTGDGATLQGTAEGIAAGAAAGIVLGEAGMKVAQVGARVVAPVLKDLGKYLEENPLPAGLSVKLVKPETALSMLEVPYDPNTGFYSPLHRGAALLPNKTMSAGEVKALLSKAQDVKVPQGKAEVGKADEWNFVGMDEFLASKPSFTKQEVLGYLESHRMPFERVQISHGSRTPEQAAQLKVLDNRVRVLKKEQLLAEDLLEEARQRGHDHWETSGALDPDLTQKILSRKEIYNQITEELTAAAKTAEAFRMKTGDQRTPVSSRMSTYTAGNYGSEAESQFGLVFHVNPLLKDRKHISWHEEGTPGSTGWYFHTTRQTASPVEIVQLRGSRDTNMAQVGTQLMGLKIDDQPRHVSFSAKIKDENYQYIPLIAKKLIDAGVPEDYHFFLSNGIRKGKLKDLAKETEGKPDVVPESAKFVEEIQDDFNQINKKAERTFDSLQEKGQIAPDLTYEQARWQAYRAFKQNPSGPAAGAVPGLRIEQRGTNVVVIRGRERLDEFPDTPAGIADAQQLVAQMRASYNGPRGEADAAVNALPESVDKATYQQLLAMATDEGFWSSGQANLKSAVESLRISEGELSLRQASIPHLNFGRPEMFSSRARHLKLKDALFQSAKEGQEWLTWASSDTIRQRWSSAGRGAFGLEAQKVKITREGNLALMNDVAGRNQGRAAEYIKFLKKHDAGAAAQIQAALELAKAQGKTQVVDFGKIKTLKNKAFNEYDSKDVSDMNAYLRRFKDPETGKAPTVEKVYVGRGAGQSNGVRITPWLREQILKGGMPLSMHKLEETANA